MAENTPKKTYSIRQINLSRGNKTWYGVVHTEGRAPQNISLGTTNAKAAKEWLVRMQAEELLPPLYRKALRDIPLKQAEDEFFACLDVSVKKITGYTYLSRLRPCWRYLESEGLTTLRQITQPVLLKLINSFSEDRRKTLRERFKGLKMWLVWCRDNYELADFEPWHNVKLKQLPPEPEKEFWTMPQIEAILGACPTDLYRLFIGLMAYAGLRMSEALFMRWEDFAPDLSEFSLVGKMDKFSKMPISDKLRTLIEKVRPENPEGRLFAEGKFPQRSWELMPLLKTVVMSAGLAAPGRIGHHKLRHSFATNLLRSQVDIKTVSTALRHAKVSTTLDIYVHTVDESVKDALEKL